MTPFSSADHSTADSSTDHPVVARPPIAPRRYGYRVRDIFGTHFDDPWDWLRDGENPEVIAHVEAENSWADAVCAPSAALASRLVDEVREATALTDVSVPVREGEFWYYRRWEENSSYAAHYRAPVSRDSSGEVIALVPLAGIPAEGEVLLVDENEQARGEEFFRLADLCPSPDGRFIAWARDVRGDERYTWVIQEADTGRVVDEAVSDAGYGFAWSADSLSFIYVGVDQAWRACEVWLHRVGTDPADDRLLLVEEDEAFELGVTPGAFPSHVLIHSSSTSSGRVWVWLPDFPTVRPLLLADARPNTLVSADSAGEYVYVVHTGASPEGSLARVRLPGGGVPEALAALGVVSSDADSRSTLGARESGRSPFASSSVPLVSYEAWEPLRHPSAGERFLDVEAHERYVALSLRGDGLTQVDVARVEGPGLGVWERVNVGVGVRTLVSVPTPWEDALRVEYQSQILPPVIAQVRSTEAGAALPKASGELSGEAGDASGVRIIRESSAPGWDPSEYVEERVWVKARDGVTRIPVTLVHHRSVRPDGTNAGWQIGYGSYEVSYDPEFDSLRIPLLRRTVYAIAHVRGGGEMGRSWYEDGKGLVKEHTFTDFVDVADWLRESGWVAPGRLVAEGRSAGGLLMGAVINAAPDLFRAVLAGVPFVDALTTILDPSLPLTVGEWEEWGNPTASRATFDVMSRYTPYENVPDGVELPAVMATTSLNDTRVEFVEPTKWVQRLREASGQVSQDGSAPARDPYQRPIVLRTEMVAGHAGPSGREGRWRGRCEEFAFALTQLDAQD